MPWDSPDKSPTLADKMRALSESEQAKKNAAEIEERLRVFKEAQYNRILSEIETAAGKAQKETQIRIYDDEYVRRLKNDGFHVKNADGDSIFLWDVSWD